jgi:hypothetical protein
MSTNTKQKIVQKSVERIGYVYIIRHKRLNIFKIGKSINIINRLNFMGISEFDIDSCIALELSSESMARKFESDFKRNMKPFNIPLCDAFHMLRINSGCSEWYRGEAWDSLEERIKLFSDIYEFRRVPLNFPKLIYTPRAKSLYESECIWMKRWYKRNKDLKRACHFHNLLWTVLEKSYIENIWCVNQEQFNISLSTNDNLADESWWQEVITSLHELSYSELTEKYFIYQALTCFESTIIITFNSCLDDRSAFDVKNPYDLIQEKLFAEALTEFRLKSRAILN